MTGNFTLDFFFEPDYGYFWSLLDISLIYTWIGNEGLRWILSSCQQELIIDEIKEAIDTSLSLVRSTMEPLLILSSNQMKHTTAMISAPRLRDAGVGLYGYACVNQ